MYLETKRRLENEKVLCTYSFDIIFLPNGSLGSFLLSGTKKTLRNFTDK